jgi:general secretion pathway protein K
MTRLAAQRQRRPSAGSAERGAALLTAMLIVTLIATLAASMLWQQWRAVQVEAAERARAQSAWILAGALDWARLILREDGRNGGPDHLGEPWAVPLAEARLSSFLAADKQNTEDAPDAFLSGAITDAQSRFVLNNVLLQGTNRIDPKQVAVLRRLCETVGVSADAADRIAIGIRNAAPPMPPDPSASAAPPTPPTPPLPADPPLMPETVAQLAWFGVDREAIRALEPFVTILPAGSFSGPVYVNVNTAPREVLVAAMANLDLATAERIIQARQRAPFKTPADVNAMAPASSGEGASPIVIASSYFEVRGRLRLGDVVLEQRSLVFRRQLEVTVLQRERISSRDATGS